jgi:hypothetical protein
LFEKLAPEGSSIEMLVDSPEGSEGIENGRPFRNSSDANPI